ncbi:hypothetical protein [Actinoplanes sp. NPDC089786]|uniref:hypothetical protein n=1 Tax=Actinoplanes sp. NPDC089786 TaxID=3155185 RepID=UPI00341FAF7D
MSSMVPPLLAGLVDDSALLQPGPATVADTTAGFREHHAAWYGELVGSLLVPSSLLDLDVDPPGLPVGVVNDAAVTALPTAVAKLRAGGATVRSIESAVARRGEDPQPGLAELRTLAAGDKDLEVYAEIPLSWGLLGALDAVAAMRADGLRIAPKFRVGGLAAELFPTPVELAAVICACRDRDLPFKLATGIRHALRHTDPETGFTHHGFLNVLVAVLLAGDGQEVAEVAEALGATHPVPLVEPARARRDETRPLWAGFGVATIVEPLTELVRLGLINGGYQ